MSVRHSSIHSFVDSLVHRIVVVAVVFTFENKYRSDLSIKYCCASVCPNLSVLIQTLDVVDSRGHKLTYLKGKRIVKQMDPKDQQSDKNHERLPSLEPFGPVYTLRWVKLKTGYKVYVNIT